MLARRAMLLRVAQPARITYQNLTFSGLGLTGSVVNKRLIHSIARSGEVATAGETPILVYDSPEFKAFDEAFKSSNGNEGAFSAALSSEYRSKFFSLIPFFWESNFTYK